MYDVKSEIRRLKMENLRLRGTIVDLQEKLKWAEQELHEDRCTEELCTICYTGGVDDDIYTPVGCEIC